MLFRFPRLVYLIKANWEEQKHPRADDGKFTSGSGGGSKKPSKTKRKLERRAEAASQGRVSGAIQTLLSGGSALDKIGWLNTSKPKEPEKKPESKPQQPEKPKVEEKPSQAFNPDDISWSKPASYDGVKQIYPVIRNTGVSSSNLGRGMGIRIDQRGKDAWQVKLLYTGFDKNGHYTSRSVFLGEPGPLRQIKAHVKGIMTDSGRLNKLVSELERRQKELKS